MIPLSSNRRVRGRGGIENKGILITADMDISVQIGLYDSSNSAGAVKVSKSMKNWPIRLILILYMSLPLMRKCMRIMIEFYLILILA